VVFKLKESNFVKPDRYCKILVDGKTDPIWVRINKCNWMVI
jgi:hypothetical protein